MNVYGARSLVVKLLLVEQVSRVQFSPGTQIFLWNIVELTTLCFLGYSVLSSYWIRFSSNNRKGYNF